VQARFKATDGTDPIFRTNDGTNSPNADVWLTSKADCSISPRSSPSVSGKS
jgi:hypothetical protein